MVSTIFTKLYDNYGVAEALRKNWDEFTDPVAVCLDQSKFDGHYITELLKIEHGYWKSISNSKVLRLLLSLQIKQKGKTACGLRYKTVGHRMSGEYTTSSGNSVTNYSMLAQFCKACGFNKFRISVNGDDSVLFIESSELHKMISLDYFLGFNMETECDRIVSDFQKISYCQASPVRVMTDQGLRWYMTKEPARSISRLCFTDIQHLPSLDRFLAGIGLCELAIASGIPVMQSIATSIIMQSNLNSPLASIDRIPAAKSGNKVAIRPISDITRSDYDIAFGISIPEQYAIEASLAGEIKNHPRFKDIQPYLKRYETFSILSERKIYYNAEEQ
jgi:hypothetical protein